MSQKSCDKLGIADDVAARLRIFPNGATAMRHLAESDARRPIGCTQSTEIISTKGVMLSGSLPPGCELATMYTAASQPPPPTRNRRSSLIDLVDRRGTARIGGNAPASSAAAKRRRASNDG